MRVTGVVQGGVVIMEDKWIFPDREGCPNCGNPPDELVQPIPGATNIWCPKCDEVFAWATKYKVTYTEEQS
jgi:ribosomal protein S27AE